MTTAGRRSGWAYLLAISETFTVAGIDAKPRTLTECTRPQRSWSTSTDRARSTSAVSATRASSRARLAPRQKCRPPPKDRIWSSSSLSRKMSYSSGRLKTRSSRLAEPRHSSSFEPCGADDAVQLDVAEQVARQQLARGVVAQRLLDPRLHQLGVTRAVETRASCSGCRVRWNSAWPSSLVVVSLPATTIRNRNAMTSSSDSRSPSISASISALVRSSLGWRRRWATISW